MTKKRVHQLAAALGFQNNRDLVEKLQKLGFDVVSHSSRVDEEEVRAALRRADDRNGQPEERRPKTDNRLGQVGAPRPGPAKTNTPSPLGASGDLLQRLMAIGAESPTWPLKAEFRVAHEDQRDRLDWLEQQRYLTVQMDRYVPTLKGVYALPYPVKAAIVADLAGLLRWLQDQYRRSPFTPINDDILGQLSPTSRNYLHILSELGYAVSTSYDKQGSISAISLTERVLDLEPLQVAPPSEPDPNEDASVQIQQLRIAGFKPFRDLEVTPNRGLTVVIGANASGKSSLFQLLDWLAGATQVPIPPEIIAAAPGSRIFHWGGPEQIDLALDWVWQNRLYRYQIAVMGPQGRPTVSIERLEYLPSDSTAPYLYFELRGGSGKMRQPDNGRLVPLALGSLPPNELLLRRALTPEWGPLAVVRQFISGWRVYSGFDISIYAPVRQPAPVEPEPQLSPDGGNLSAVLLYLQTEYPEVFAELELQLRLSIPGFEALSVKAVGGRGMVMATWKESGQRALTLADLSDGTLRFLGWATLCLHPHPPSLIAIDEPELGLHPRVLPGLAGLLKIAATRCQIWVATHSPYFLSQFSLMDIRVMRKEDGRAICLRPDTNRALQLEVEALGDAALAQLYISEELEQI